MSICRRFSFQRARAVANVVAFSCGLVLSTVASAQVIFSDVSVASGIDLSTESYGASIGDVNGDGLLDIFSNNHRQQPSLFLNRGSGTFVDVGAQVSLTWVSQDNADTHGGAFADYDGDGDKDLVISLGTGNPNQFMVNDHGAFINRSSQLVPVGNIALGGRLPIWLDWNDDGRLDFFMTQFGGSGRLFTQTTLGTFVDDTTTAGVVCLRFQYGQLFDVDNNDSLEVLCPDDAVFPQKIYDTFTTPWTDVTTSFPSIPQVADTILADFDNDLRVDVFALSNVQLRPSSVTLANPTTIEAALIAGEKGFTFETTGTVTFDLDWNGIDDGLGLATVRIGTIEFNPFQVPFVLAPSDPNVVGVPPSDPGAAPIMRIGYDPAAQRWTVIAQTENIFSSAYYTVTSTAPITNLNSTGLVPSDQGGVPTLISNTAGGYVDNTAFAGLDTLVECASVTAGDFDNDMDVDLYLACRTGAENLANIYYDNNGNGTFTAVTNAGGAAGPIGANVTDAVGTADTVVTGDFDADGFLDLFVTNGFALRPLNFGGPLKLYENQGNTNHWIQLDLFATVGAREPVGARVTATAGGNSQLRVYDGAYHRWAQNAERLHFGLGTNTTVDLLIEWPDGTSDTYLGVAADQIYTVEQGTAPVAITPGVGNPFACGAPTYDAATEAGVFVWRDCLADAWRVRYTSGGPLVRYDGTVITDEPFVSSTGVSIEGNDTFDNTTDPLSINYSLAMINAGEDGYNLVLTDTATVCIDVAAPAGANVFYGPFKEPIAPSFDLKSGAACSLSLLEVSVDDVTVSEATATADFTLTLSSVPTQPVSVDVATADVTAIAGLDYTAVGTTTVTFATGITTATVSVPIINDATGEGLETFELQLSNPVNTIIADPTGVGTITDDEISACGEPSFDRATELGTFIWQDCNTGAWSARFTGGPSTTTVFYDGAFISDQPFISVTGVSLEGNDVVDATTDPQQIAYDLRMIGGGIDGIDFSAGGASICFEPSDSHPVFIGAGKASVATPVELNTLGSCSALPETVNVADVSVAENAGSVDLSVTLSQPATAPVSVTLTTVDGTATAGVDYTASGAVTVSFAVGEDTQLVNVPILDDALAEGAETFLVQLSNPSGVILGSGATVTITDDEVSPCGAPSINAGSEAGVFVWRECGTTNDWRFRVTGGGTFTQYDGDVVSSSPFTAVTGFSIEGSDVFNTTDPQVIDYALRVSGSGSDGADFTPAAGSSTCFDITAPTGTSALLGVNKTPVAVPFDLQTLGACSGLPPEASVADVSAGEAAGTVSVTVTLSATSTSDVSVLATLVDGSAELDRDLIGPAAQTLVIPAGNLSGQLSFDLVQDTLAEGDETLSLVLSSPMNAVLGQDTALITIQDDELSPCGVPSYNPVTDPGVYLFKDCASDTWSMRVAGGGVFGTYSGDIVSGAAFANVTEFSVEANDTLDSTTDPAIIDYALTVSGGGQDGADLELAPFQDACFDLSAAPTGGSVFVGPAKTPLTPPFSLNTLGACGTLPVISTSDETVTESDTVDVRLVLTTPSPTAITLNFATVDGTAVAGNDYTAASGSLTIPAGASTAVIPVSTIDDALIESAEDFTVQLSSAVGATLAQTQSLITLIDNDSASLSIDDVTVSETAGTATFTVSLSTAELTPVTVNVQTANGSAQAGLDYVAVTSTTLTFAPGETTKPLAVTIFDDLLIEGTETFQVQLSNAVGASIAVPAGTGTILDDEAVPLLSIADATASETDPTVGLTLTLSAPSAQPVSFIINTADGTATAGLDYTPATAVLGTIPAGIVVQTFTVPLIDDAIVEGDETFTVNLSSPSGALLGQGSALVTLTDDEANPTLTISDVLTSEDAGTVTFTATLSASTGFPVSADWTTGDITATAPADYVSASGTVTFSGGSTSETIVIGLTDDVVIESDETFELLLSNPTGLTLGTLAAVATIGDDDSVVCGEPSFDPATESVIAVWLNCDGSNLWSLRVTAGPSGFKSHPGAIRSNQGFGTITGVSIEPGDSLQTSDPSSILFTLGLSAPGLDGIDFELSPTATVCFNINVPPGSSVVVGSNRTPAGGSFDLRTLQPCTDLPDIAIQDVTVVEGVGALAQVAVTLDASPTQPVTIQYETIAGTATAGVDYQSISTPQTLSFAVGQQTATADVTILDDTAIELDETFSVRFSEAVNATFGIGNIDASAVVTIDDNEVLPAFEVQDLVLNEAAGTVTYDVVLTAPATVATTVDVQTADLTATAAADYAAIASQTLSFGVGVVTRSITLDILEDALAEGPEAFEVTLSNAVGAPIGRGTATIEIVDNEPSPCGVPSYDPTTEQALFFWKDCATGTWEATVTGGASFTIYDGDITSSAAYTGVVPISIEANDVLDFMTDPAVIDYNLRVGASFEDGLQFLPAAGSTTCATLNLPVGTPVFVGAARNPVGASFSLDTLGSCP